MTNSELNRILLELYTLEPDLREHEETLKSLILKMSGLKPDTKFDPAFAARLKATIIGESSLARINNEPKKQLINFNYMNKKIYWTSGSLAVMAVIIFVITSLMNPGLVGPRSESPAGSISELPAGAFGNLASLNSPNQETAASGNGLVAPLGLGGDGQESGALAARSIASDGNLETSAVSSDLVDSKMMILPYYGFNYEYVGEEINLTESEGAVYRRLKGDGQAGRALAGLVSGLDVPEIDLSTFSNLRTTNLSLTEDKDLGLMITLDYMEDNIFISENWERWRIMERENCAGDQACWDRWRLQIADVPADANLIAQASSFLNQHKVSLEHYGEPIVDNNWREMYIQAPDKNNFYIPEYASVIYPLLINGDPVRDQSGSYSGLRVTINLLRNAASGLSGLSPYRYESSAYELETDAQNVIAAAEKGGWNRGWFGGSENTRTLKLGTPEKALVQMWRYADGRSSELMVPALIFPVLEQPTDGTYYGGKYVTVPLVKEMLAELNKEQSNWPRPVDGRGGDEPVTIMETIDTQVDISEPAPGEDRPSLLIESR